MSHGRSFIPGIRKIQSGRKVDELLTAWYYRRPEVHCQKALQSSFTVKISKEVLPEWNAMQVVHVHISLHMDYV